VSSINDGVHSQDRLADREGSWLLRKPTDQASARLFCFPYSGVGASSYARWPARIGPAEVCLIQPPGRENRFREPHYGGYAQLAERLVLNLLPYLDRPFAFFGHCSSVLAGFATILELQRHDVPAPARLFVSSQVAPHDGPHGRFLRMTDGELIEELVLLSRSAGSEAGRDLIELGLGTLRADVEANKSYRLEAPVRLGCPITVIGWQDDAEVAPELMGGWVEYDDQVRFTTIPGSHHSFLTAPLALRAELGHDLELAVAGQGARS
jgi:surfactin synthase thioesterase subunit